MEIDENNLSEEKKNALKLIMDSPNNNIFQNSSSKPQMPKTIFTEIVDTEEQASAEDIGNAMRRMIEGQCRTVDPR